MPNFTHFCETDVHCFTLWRNNFWSSLLIFHRIMFFRDNPIEWFIDISWNEYTAWTVNDVLSRSISTDNSLPGCLNGYLSLWFQLGNRIGKELSVPISFYWVDPYPWIWDDPYPWIWDDPYPFIEGIHRSTQDIIDGPHLYVLDFNKVENSTSEKFPLIF